MEFAVGLFPTGPADQMVARAVLAEELGFDAFWVADTHLIWRDAWVLLGAIAEKTTRIAIGPGVTHPVVRHPSLIAAAIHALSELAPGRVKLGIGVGDSGPANMGLPRATLAQLEQAVLDIRGLLNGEEMRGSHAPLRLAYASHQPVELFVAAASDRTHRMSGRIADGAFIAGPRDEIASAIAAIRAGERAAGRPNGATKTVFFTNACFAEDEEIARQAVRAVVARKAIISLTRDARLGRISEADRDALHRVQAAYDTHHHMEPRYNELVPDSWVDRFSLGGTLAQVRDACAAAGRDGAAQVAVVFVGDGIERQMRTFAETVIAPLRAGIQAVGRPD